MKLRLPRLSRARLVRVIRTPWLPWVLVAVLLATTLVNWSLYRGRAAEGHRRGEVESTARRFLQTLTNYDWSTIEADVRRIESYAVDGFADETRRVFRKSNIDQIKKNRGGSTGTVRILSVESVSGDTAKVFSVVDLTLRRGSQESAQRSAIEVTLIDTTSGWKVERVTTGQISGGAVGAG